MNQTFHHRHMFCKSKGLKLKKVQEVFEHKAQQHLSFSLFPKSFSALSSLENTKKFPLRWLKAGKGGHIAIHYDWELK